MWEVGQTDRRIQIDKQTNRQIYDSYACTPISKMILAFIIVVYSAKAMDGQFLIILTMTMSTMLFARGMDATSVFPQEMPDTCLSGRHHKVSIICFPN